VVFLKYKYLKLKRLAAVTLFLAMLLLPMGLPSEAQNDIPRGGTFTITLGSEPRVISPFSGSWSSGVPAAQMFNSLLGFDSDTQPTIPRLATELPVINEAEGSYTFKLRQGVKWHDGEPMTAEDVKFTFEEMAQYDIFAAKYFENSVVDIIDEETIKITPGTFWPGIQMPLFAGLDTSIVPKHILEGVEDYISHPFRTTEPVGTGPFKFKEWVTGSYIILERFDDYWNAPTPYLDEVVIKVIPEPSTMLAAFQTGESDYQFRGLPYDSYDTLAANPELNVIKYNRPPYKAMLSFNHIREYLSDINVRKAITYALNRVEMAELATNGLCQVTDTFWTPDIAPPSPDNTIYTYDPVMANTLLDEAGYAKGADGMRFTIELLTRRGEAEEELLGDLIEDYLSEVGITVDRKVVDFGTQLQLTSNYEYDMSLTKRWVQTFWTYQLFHSDWIIPGQNFANALHYENEEMDATFDAWLVETDPMKQQELLQKVDEIATREIPQLPIYDLVWINVIRKTFQPVPGAKVGTLPDCRYVFWDSLENTYWTEGTVVPEITLDTALIWITTVFSVGTTVLILHKRRKLAN